METLIVIVIINAIIGLREQATIKKFRSKREIEIFVMLIKKNLKNWVFKRSDDLEKTSL
jgi:hypothetical protein